MNRLTARQIQHLRQWGPAVLTATCAWLLLVALGQTTVARATGLALAVLGVTASMRPMGLVASIAGGFALTLSPVFWSQAGGAVTQPASIIVAAMFAAFAVLCASFLLKRNELARGLGILFFAVIFWSQINLAQSLRLTVLVTAWLLFLLIDMLILTNPRPGIKPPQAPKRWHLAGIPALFAIGALNDPLVTLFAPAILLSLLLSYAQLPGWYWLAIVAIAAAGAYLLAQTYLLAASPLLLPLGWRDAHRWLALGEYPLAQFGWAGIALSIVGVARLARWYPPLGTVTLIAFASYMLFGLNYIGSNREILLLPLVIIQVIWMTYAVNSISQWVNKTLRNRAGLWIHLVSALYIALPALLLLDILQT
ncbi:MAG: hypothetical protein OXE95_12490 [Chloroflexi bacterium]|nr:hypothetical protein [Chloroflexota bacterium]MCY4248379.1 hypothetical protein [Chloroflexota bacterium]